ncbi:MAG: SCO family protein [Flavobacteriaceae bacterium]|nr:SCO family protein [Flavobacteriaceae bacterium]|tara:strand:+ start:31293 stop:31988 length:696 start_codon:yes stop_codon:yes gene_type:complete
MRNTKYIGLILVIIIFGFIFIPKIVSRITNSKIVESNRSQSSIPLQYVFLNGEAKKVPEFAFLNQDSIIISNEDFNKKVYVAEFFFTSCPSICPIMNKNMKRIENRFGKRQDFGIASFSIDPIKDTPSVLKAYAETYDVFSQNWHFLTGEKDKIYNLANEGFNIFASVNPRVAGGFEHQGYFALIDKNGFIRCRSDQFGNPIVYYMGVDEEDVEIQEVDLLIDDIEKLLKE